MGPSRGGISRGSLKTVSVLAIVVGSAVVYRLLGLSIVWTTTGIARPELDRFLKPRLLIVDSFRTRQSLAARCFRARGHKF